MRIVNHSVYMKIIKSHYSHVCLIQVTCFYLFYIVQHVRIVWKIQINWKLIIFWNFDTSLIPAHYAEYWLVLWLNSNCCLWLLRCHADINSYTNHQFYLWLLLQCYPRVQNKGCDPIETLNDKQTWFHVVYSNIE